MGEITEDMTDGTCCTFCGQYFKGEKKDECYTHGYPVLCWECWKKLSEEDKQGEGLQRARRPVL